mgnify:CR=1 FL=1
MTPLERQLLTNRLKKRRYLNEQKTSSESIVECLVKKVRALSVVKWVLRVFANK